MKGSARCRMRAAVVFLTPLVLLGGILTLPYVSDYGEAALADEVASASTRWAWGGLLIAVGIGMMVLVTFAARTYLRDHGEDLWSLLAVPLAVMGAAMLLYRLGFEGMTRAGMALPEPTGQSLTSATPGLADTLSTWRLWIGVAGAGLMGLGGLSLVVSAARNRRFTTVHVGLMAVGVLAAIAAIFIPAHWALYLLGGGALLATWTIAERMWTDPSEPQPVLELIREPEKPHARAV